MNPCLYDKIRPFYMYAHVSTLTVKTSKCFDNLWHRYVSFGSQLRQIGPKWDKYGTFFRSYFSTFWLGEPKCTKIRSEKVSDLFYLMSIWSTFAPNLPSMLWKGGDCACVNMNELFPLKRSDMELTFYQFKQRILIWQSRHSTSRLTNRA